VDEFPAISYLQGVIVLLLVSNGAGSLGAHSPAAERSHAMSGIDLAFVGKLEDLVMEVIEQR